MRVALVTETFLPSVDGVVTRLTRALDWLLDHGHETLVVAPDLGVSSYRGARVTGVRAVTWPVYRSRPWGTPSHKVASAIRGFAPDLVHAWQPSLVGFWAVEECRRGGVPLVTSYHTDIASYLDYYGPLRLLRRPIAWYERRSHNLAALTLVTSEAMRAKLARAGVERLRVLPRGVDVEARDPRFRDGAMRERLSGGRPGLPLAVYVGRVSAEKGLAGLVPAFRAHPEWALAVVGDGPGLPALKRELAGTGTVFTGFLSGGELSRAFASADAFVFPSTTETLGLVILEAMASGVPVVAARSPATLGQIRDGENGLVYDPHGEGALARALARAFGDPGLAGRIRERGLAEARANSWEGASAAVYASYEEALGMYAAGWAPPRRPGRAPRLGGGAR